MKKNSLIIRKLSYSALCLALAYTLPYLTGQIPELGQALCPMHLPVLLCGFLCGWQYGLIVGAAAPLLRSVTLGMPPMFPTAIAMAFELSAYGALAGLLYRLLPKKLRYVYVTLAAAMLGGRAVWGAVSFAIVGFDAAEFPFSAFITGAFARALPGILLQIVLLPLVVLALSRAHLTANE